jgi:ABC-type glycerol-3-phosphate transport system substrate-binding protein
MRRRTLLAIGAKLAASLPALSLLTACGALPVAPSILKKQPVNIRFVMGPYFAAGAVDAGDIAQMPPIVESFQKAFPDIMVETVQVRDFRAFQDYSALYLDPSAASHGDLLLVRNWGGPIDQTKLVSLEPLLKRDREAKVDDYYVQALHRLTFQGHLIGMPRDIQPSTLVYYNTDLLQEAGVTPPSVGWTLDEFLDTTQHIARVFATKPEASMHFGFTDVSGTDGLYAFVQIFGGAWLDKTTGLVTIDDDAAVAGAQFYADLHLKYHVLPSRLERSVSYGGGSPITQFILGHVPMFATSPDFISLLRTMQRQLSWDIATLPIKADVKQNWDGVGTALMIPKASTQQDAAWTLAKYLSIGPGMQARAQLGDLHPASKKIASGTGWLNKQPPNGRPLLNSVGIERMLDYDPTAVAATQGTPTAGGRLDLNAMGRSVYYDFDDFLSGKLTAKQMLSHAKDEANKAAAGH